MFDCFLFSVTTSTFLRVFEPADSLRCTSSSDHTSEITILPDVHKDTPLTVSSLLQPEDHKTIFGVLVVGKQHLLRIRNRKVLVREHYDNTAQVVCCPHAEKGTNEDLESPDY